MFQIMTIIILFFIYLSFVYIMYHSLYENKLRLIKYFRSNVQSNQNVNCRNPTDGYPRPHKKAYSAQQKLIAQYTIKYERELFSCFGPDVVNNTCTSQVTTKYILVKHYTHPLSTRRRTFAIHQITPFTCNPNTHTHIQMQISADNNTPISM